MLNVYVAPSSDLSKARPVTSDKKRPVTQYFWAHTNKHILYLQDAGGDENFHVFSVNLKSGKKVDLTPFPKVQARVVGVSYRRPKEVVIGVNQRSKQLHDLYLVNLVTGERKLLEENPGFMQWLVDADYRVRLAMSMTPDGGIRIMRKKAQRRSAAKVKAARGKKEPASSPSPMDGWELFQKVPFGDELGTGPIAFDRRGKHVYMWDSRERNTSALTRVNLKTGKFKLIAEHAKADGERLHMHPTSHRVLAVSFNHARREWRFLDRAVERDFKRLSNVSRGEVNVVSATLDNKRWIVAYVEDAGPVRYYLYDRRTKKPRFLFTHRTALEKLQLARMHPRVIKSRDGLELVNYLSLPASADPDGDGKPAQAMPTVLLVHGGPWARDRWGYDGLHQLLANRGYAVLSVNYRGSTGFGKAFTNAGDGEWAGKMHDDLIDSIDWAVAEGITDKDKVCIVGGSYGGYATLVGLTSTPERFACGVDIVGPSSLQTLLEAIPPYWKPVQDLFKRRVGDWTTAEGKKFLEQRSPLSRVHKIVKPLLIGQGANDPRVKQAEADQIVQAMRSRGIPVTYVLYPDEGHGFKRKPNRLSFFAAMEAFLSAHLGGVYGPAQLEEFTGTTMQVPSGSHGVPGLPALVDLLARQPPAQAPATHP
ncbi:MAG: S9 family peptidase [Proteobacteria bacterium]|nr:S9 family peptidase [Pseudomonadota bacterium]